VFESFEVESFEVESAGCLAESNSKLEIDVCNLNIDQGRWMRPWAMDV
jgi:hypothetical protein